MMQSDRVTREKLERLHGGLRAAIEELHAGLNYARVEEILRRLEEHCSDLMRPRASVATPTAMTAAQMSATTAKRTPDRISVS